jgi:hypothetical protein
MTSRQAPPVAAVSALLIGLGIGLALRGVEPVATWLYVVCWYPTIALMAAVVARAEGRDPFTGHPVHALSLFAWSAVFWFFFELLNWRIANWYYVYVPADRVSRWIGISLAFATVLPAIFLAARVQETWGILTTVRTKPFHITPFGLRISAVTGVAFLALPLLWPRFFFPLVWVAAALLAEPALYRRAPRWSLLADLGRGEAGRLLRLLTGGAAIGLLWEMYNSFARSRWIYTVPGLEELKLFEMPLLGFLGFPVFALECWSVFHLLASFGISTPEERLAAPVPYARKAATAVLGVAFSVFVLSGMERYTIGSTTPSIAEVPGLPSYAAQKLAADGVSAFQLAEVSASDLARTAGGGVEEAARWGQALRLVTLRGIGTLNARRLAGVGVRDIATLAVQDPDSLAARLRAAPPKGTSPFRPTPAEVRVWVRAALNATVPERRPAEGSE